MRVVILGSIDSWYYRDLARAGMARGHDVQPCTFRELRAWVGTPSPLVGKGRGMERPRDPDAPTQPSPRKGQGFSLAGREIDLLAADAVLVRTMPPGSLEQVVLRMDVLHRLEAAGIPVINPPRALETAVDKYLATAKLGAAGLPVPATAVCETAEAAMDAFAALGGDAVVKPLFGSEGRGIHRVSDADLAYRVFRTLEDLRAVIYLQQYLPHRDPLTPTLSPRGRGQGEGGSDLRALVITTPAPVPPRETPSPLVGEGRGGGGHHNSLPPCGGGVAWGATTQGQVVAAMRRHSADDWRTNVARGAIAEPITLTDERERLAVQAARAVGAAIAGVDLLESRDGRVYVLEVNAVPGWRALAQVTATDIAGRVIEYVEMSATRHVPLD